MYTLKLKQKDGKGDELIPGVDHLQVTPLLSKSGQSAIGLEIDIQPHGRRIKLPQDGADLFLISDDTGVTVDSYHWPPHPKRVARRGNVKQMFRVTETSERRRYNGNR